MVQTSKSKRRRRTVSSALRQENRQQAESTVLPPPVFTHLVPNPYDGVVDAVMIAFGLYTQGDFAAMLGYTINAPSNWRKHGISATAWRKIQKKARRMGIELPPSFYE